MGADFSGYVTRYGRRCTDGRTILPHAFKHNDRASVPLVWQHQHNDPSNILGHLILEHRDDGVWAEGYFNGTEPGQQAKMLVQHKDINALSIYANQLVQTGMNVTHGNIKEGSLVLAGANPGAYIENVAIQHGDDYSVSEDEVVIYSGDEISHAGSIAVAPPKKIVMPSKGQMPKPTGATPTASNPDPDGDGDNDLFDPADGGLGSDASVEDVFNTFTPEQKNVVYALLGAAAQQSDEDDPAATITHDQKGNDPVTRNVFDQTGADPKIKGNVLSHSDQAGIFAAARKCGSLKEAVEEYAIAHGIDDISVLFPYDQAVTDTPDWISRRVEWVAGVLSATRKTPFSRIRSWTADITLEEARAKGYVKAGMKKEEYFAVAKRITTPQTIYKKQKLDRDDILDINEFDVVTWLQTEMRIMLDEELARAILVGDNREVDDPDKINPTNVRPIYGDDDMYVTNLNVDLTSSGATGDAIVDAVVNGMRFYRGSGNPIMYTTLPYLSKMLLTKDTLGRRLYQTKVELASALGVSDIVACEALEMSTGLIGVVVNLMDYTIGADKGGEVSMFDFFDIDFNQYKYLMETRVSGAMIKYRGALTITEVTGTLLAEPTAPTFVANTGIVTIPTDSNVTYVTVSADGTESAALTAGAQAAIADGTSVHIRAKADAGYFFEQDAGANWIFTANYSA